VDETAYEFSPSLTSASSWAISLSFSMDLKTRLELNTGVTFMEFMHMYICIFL
jgi:hypothetical protein